MRQCFHILFIILGSLFSSLWGTSGTPSFFYVFLLRKVAGRLLYSRNNLKHRNMNTNNLNYNGQSSIDRINEVIERNKRIVEELNAMYDSVRRF